MTESERPSGIARLKGWLRQTRAQLVLLGGVLGVVILAIIITDLVTGGDTESPEPLGESVETAPRTRVITVPTLAPIETPAPEIVVSATPSSKADALARDAQRLRDLELLEEALARYYERFGEYPDNDGGIQTLCAYTELDKGCDLKKVLDKDEEDMLEDPLGVPLDNGYWYSSDGKTYTIWTLREGPADPGDPICRDVVAHLKDKAPLFCLTVGGGSR